MTSESELIPYEAGTLLGERLLVLAPHPDDEVIGCGGLLRQHVLDGRKVRVVIATDGAAGGEGGDLAARREAESRAGLALLGAPEPEFLRFPDRQLTGMSAELQARLAAILLDYRPDLLLVPAPTEIHPDHVALSRAVVDLLQRDEALRGAMPLCRVAFYEVSQPFRPNTLVDVTAFAPEKFRALEEHRSQTGQRDYAAYTEGLNRYRSMTLGADARYAEGYWVTTAETVAVTPWSRLATLAGGQATIEVTAETLPITVVVRTKNRLAWLRESVDSILANDYPAQVLVVNDGGESPLAALPSSASIRVVEHETSRGRAEAANRGVSEAATPFVSFLDDDDLYYREHLSTLATAMQSTGRNAVYTDAVSVHLRLNDEGKYEPAQKLRTFSRDFDRTLLLVDNYIPLPTLLLRRDEILAAGGFDGQFDLFEDWDLLIRLSGRGEFARVPRVTCEIRHFPQGGSAVLESPEGSRGFRDAKLAVWRKHGKEVTFETLAEGLEKQKRALGEARAASAGASGRAQHLELDVDRLTRDKENLMAQLGEAVRAADRAVGGAAEIERLLKAAYVRSDELVREAAVLEEQSRRDRAAAEEQRARADQRDESLRATYAEIARLNELLSSVYQSKSWRLHLMLERLKGRHA